MRDQEASECIAQECFTIVILVVVLFVVLFVQEEKRRFGLHRG
jgi:hypothetical protein